jgi:2-aminoadipate transaminase
MIPDFQNPTGRSWNLERRQALARLARQHEVMVIEDNPYGELRFAGQALPSVQALAPDCVLSLGTFSKIFCPGYRIGWIAGAAEVIGKYALVKQGVDLQCNTLAQMGIARYLDSCDIDAHITLIRDVYRRRRDAMIRAMEIHFPPGVTFTRPDGGLFAWVELPAGLDARCLLARSLEQQVAFVPGDSFYPNGGHANTLRLNFSNMPEDRICEGIARLGRIIRVMLSGLA